MIDEVDAKSDALKSTGNAGYDSASIEDSKKEHQVSAQAKQTMANIDANANNLAANEIMSASNDYAAAAEKLSQQNFNDITEAQNKYLRALNVLAQTTETFNKTIDKNYEEDFAKSKKEQQSAAVGKTIEEAHTKVAESVEKSVLSANTLLKDPSITDVVKEQAKNVLNFIASSGVQMFETLTNTAIKLQGEISNRVRAVANRASLSSQGIIVDTKTGTITQTQHSLSFDENDQINVYGDRTINFDASKLS